jgi:hypothetical protein
MFFEDVRAYQATGAYQQARRTRQVWAEPLFAKARGWHGLRRCRLRRRWRVHVQRLLTASGQDRKRLLCRYLLCTRSDRRHATPFLNTLGRSMRCAQPVARRLSKDSPQTERSFCELLGAVMAGK